MSSRLRTLTVDCHQWEPLVAFWSEVGDFSADPSNPNEEGDPEGLLVSERTGLALLFIPVPEAKSVKNRMHVDLVPTDRTRDEEVARLMALGATLYADHRRDDGSGFVVLADPEGNEFCVERSEAERSRAGADGERSWPHATVTPRIFVDDVEGIVSFLRTTFGAVADIQSGRPTDVQIGDSVVMISSTEERNAFASYLYIYVDDADRAYERAMTAGATSIESPLDTPYGDRRAMVSDRFGNIYQIAHRPRVD
jgi:uncharacterized glyoxalase superfamily protein PhnB